MLRRLRAIPASLLMLAVIVSAPSAGKAEEASAAGAAEGAAFAMTNASSDNRIVTYRRAANGTLTRVGSISTGGRGIGVDLDTQSGLELSADHRYLYAVNAGSDEITIFGVNGPNLTFLQKVAAGDQPVSLSIHGNLLYSLDASVAGNGIRGFRIAANGTLTPIANSFRLLSSPIAVPGEVQFSPDGKVLLVTHKTTNVLLNPANAIDAFTVGSNGLASATPRRNASFGLRPFSLAYRADGSIIVVESFNAAPNASAISSYRSGAGGRMNVVDGSVANGQTDACWVVITGDGRYAFVANFGSGTISSYRFNTDEDLRLVNGAAASTGAMSQPVDLALSSGSKYLHLLLRGTGAVASYRIDGGTLHPLGVVTGGLPVADGASGLASY